MSHYIKRGTTISTPRVNGEAPYVLHIAQDPDACTQLTEGALAALYLLREHQVAQNMRDAGEFLDPPTDTEEPPEPGTPPGYYLG